MKLLKYNVKKGGLIMPEKKLNCAKCLRYASDGDTEHHQYCPTIADDQVRAKKDYMRGFKVYEKRIIVS